MEGSKPATELQKFRELTRLILQVPKSEIADKLKPRKRGKHKKLKRD